MTKKSAVIKNLSGFVKYSLTAAIPVISVMGDDGVKYDMFTDGLLAKMKELTCQADVLTPNLKELCLLTKENYETVCYKREQRRFW